VVVAPIFWDVAVPYHGVSTQMVNVQELPDSVREYINETVHLNQAIDELEALVAQCETRGEPIRPFALG
jgi:hypothetical protein